MPRKPRHKQGPRFRFTLNWENTGGDVQGVTKVEPLGRRTKQMGVTFWAKQSGDDGWKLHYVPPQTPYRRKHEKYIRENFPEPTPWQRVPHTHELAQQFVQCEGFVYLSDPVVHYGEESNDNGR